VLIGLVAFATMRRRNGPGEDPFAFDGADYPPSGYDTERSNDDDYSAAMFGDNYAREGLGALPSHGLRSEPASAWGAPVSRDDEVIDDDEDAYGGAYHSADESAYEDDYEDDFGDDEVVVDEDDEDDEGALLVDEEDDPDAVDTTPTPIPKVLERDPMIDSGRHARVDVDEPAPPRTAFRLPLDDTHEPPENYPVKADTKSGLYWGPDSEQYHEAHAEIWFASEELARANGFTSAD
jgi:uncharacterized protein with LGFP repeats